MRKTFAVLATIALVALFALAGCSKKPDAKLIGTWVVDPQATVENSPEEMSDEDREQALAMFEAMAMTLTFSDDGTATMSMTSPFGGEARTESGNWEIISSEGDTLTLKVTSEDDDEEDEITLTFHSDDSVSMAEGDDVIYFTRQ